MPDDLWTKLYDNWPEWAIILALIFRSQLAVLVPQVVKDYFMSKQKIREVREQHIQDLKDREAKLQELSRLSDMNEDAYLKQIFTQLTADTQTQLIEAYSFIRQDVSLKLDIVIQQLDILQRELKRHENVFHCNNPNSQRGRGTGNSIDTKKLEPTDQSE